MHTLMHLMQGYVLPPLGLLAYLKPDGTYYPNPWLDEPSPASDPSLALEASPPETPMQARQDSRPSSQASTQDSQPSSELDPQQLLAAASARLSQRSAAELAHATSSHGIDTAGTAGSQQESQSFTTSVQEPQPKWGQGFQQALVQSAAALACNSPLPGSRFQAMSWLTLLVPQLTDQGCTDVASSEAVQASVRMIQREAEPARTRAAAVEFCLALHDKGALPVAALLEAGTHRHLAKIVAQTGQAQWGYCTVRPSACHFALIQCKNCCIEVSHAALDTFTSLPQSSLLGNPDLALYQSTPSREPSADSCAVKILHICPVLSGCKTSIVAVAGCCILLCAVSEETSVTQ